MNTVPSVIVFDVNETLSDMSPMAGRFKEIGAPVHLAKLWFANLLRDGFALTAAGDNVPFAKIGTEALYGLLHDVPLNRDVDEAVEHVMEGMAALDVHPDVPGGARTLKAAGYRLVTLTNGGTQVAEKLFTAARIREEFELLLSVEDAPVWKPNRSSYDYAAHACDVRPEQMLLVAVHPWDIHGASSAGLSTAWINRTGGPYPDYFRAPDLTVSSLEELTDNLATGTSG